MQVDSRRIQKQNSHEYTSGKILYWMNRDMRLSDNWALIRAQQLSKQYEVELLVIYNLDPEFLGGTLRQLDFKIKGLIELAANFEKHNISFSIIVDSNIDPIIESIEKNNVGFVITDFSPLRVQRKWLQTLCKKTKIPVEVVDTHNIVPIWEASDKKEFAAYTIRPKINKKLKDFLTDFPLIQKQKNREVESVVIYDNHKKEGDITSVLEYILEHAQTNRKVSAVTWCTPGEKSAHKVFKKFIEHSEEYALQRNNPVHDVQSQLSPYLHYGMISPQRVAFEVSHSKMNPESKKDFLEELIIRRELADNFCYYEPHYDTPEGFHDYFKKELKQNESVKREYVYTKKQFEEAQTHDDLWNACQMQLVTTGKMHGYLRMYWAKMIYAWTKNVEEAMKIAIYLNDTYELDGRDPNGYTGIAWCIGGVHDRPWYVTNPVFGKLRYMSRGGMDKKFDTKAYIEKWMQTQLL